jgi:hypothetical protein
MKGFNFNLDGVWFFLIGTFCDREDGRAFDMQRCDVNRKRSPIAPEFCVDMALHFVDVLCKGGITVEELELAANCPKGWDCVETSV